MTDLRDAVVETKNGKIEGNFRDGVFVFKGIPYAAPPLGRLRWLPPQPVDPWEGVRPAKAFGPNPPQNLLPGEPIEFLRMEGPQNEDCLYLNIWTPACDNGHRPVMVWIHGGAFVIGSGNQPVFDTGVLAARGNVVYVTLSYRLGALGFMNLKEVTGGQIPATGNEGLLDQVAVLQWIHENIAAFGGDPGNITVFGESAGGMSIGCLMGMPAARGKFQKAILQSGAANTVGALSDAADIAGQYLEILGVQSGDVDALRSVTVKQLMNAQQTLSDRLREARHVITPFQPLVDGEVIPELPIEAIQKGSARGIIVLAGTNLDEWKLFGMMEPGLSQLDETSMAGRLMKLIPADTVHQLIEAYRNARKQRGAATTPLEILSAIQTDLMFRMPAIRLVEAQLKHKQPIYNYLFTWKSPVSGGILGACHALEIGFVFGNHDGTFCGTGPDADRLSRTIQDAWISFARNGNPSCGGTGIWQPYGDRRATMILDKTIRIQEAPFEDERRAWDGFSMVFTKPI